MHPMRRIMSRGAITGDVVFRYRHAEFLPVSWQCGLPPAFMVNRHKELSALDRVVAERSPTVIVLKGHLGLAGRGSRLRGSSGTASGFWLGHSTLTSPPTRQRQPSPYL
jgi:hypothetical protein